MHVGPLYYLVLASYLSSHIMESLNKLLVLINEQRPIIGSYLKFVNDGFLHVQRIGEECVTLQIRIRMISLPQT